MDILKFIAIKTDKGYYITDNIKGLHFYDMRAGKLKYDGKEAKGTFHKHWFLIPELPKKVTKEVQQPNINLRYELRDKKQFPKLKEVYKEEEALTKIETDDDDYVDKWSKEFAEIRSLYEFASDRQKPIDEMVQVEFVVLAEMKKIPGRIPFKYEVKSDGFDGKVYDITNDELRRNILDKIITPEILMHTKSCSLTSHDTYKIVRQYIKQNINLRVAEISSDYDFCFGVQKLIALEKDEEYTIDLNMFSKKKPQYVKRYRTNRKIKIFEMGWSPKCYGDYTPIEGFTGKDEKDLKGKVDRYLKNLITMINEPIKECSYCKGRGVIIKEGEKKNGRKESN